MMTTVTCWAARWSRNARIWLVIDPQVVTVDEVFRPLPPWMRMQTFASRLETSMPAHRGCTTSMTHLTFHRPTGVHRIELVDRVRVPGRADQNWTLTCVLTGNNTRFPRTNYCALHHQTDTQDRGTTDGSGSTGTHPESVLHQPKQQSSGPIMSGPASPRQPTPEHHIFRPHGGAE